jgi:hypothetical protein
MIKYDADTHVLTVGCDFNILRGSISVHRHNRKPRLVTYIMFAGYLIDEVIIDVSVANDFMDSQMWRYLMYHCTTGCDIKVISDKLYFPKLKELKLL